MSKQTKAVMDHVKEMAESPQSPQAVGPSPVPLTVNVAAAQRGDGTKLIVLEVHSPTGAAVYFMPPDFAVTVAKMIADNAAVARSGLIVPPHTVVADMGREALERAGS